MDEAAAGRAGCEWSRASTEIHVPCHMAEPGVAGARDSTEGRRGILGLLASGSAQLEVARVIDARCSMRRCRLLADPAHGVFRNIDSLRRRWHVREHGGRPRWQRVSQGEGRDISPARLEPAGGDAHRRGPWADLDSGHRGESHSLGCQGISALPGHCHLVDRTICESTRAGRGSGYRR